jgi:hypothetical protein
MMGLIVFLGYVAAIFISACAVTWLVAIWPKSGFSLDEENPAQGWKVLRNILAVPASIYMFYHFSMYQTAKGLGPWPMMDPEKGFYSFGLAGAAVRSVGGFFDFLFTTPKDFLIGREGVFKSISQNGSNEALALLVTLALGILIIAVAIAALKFLGEALAVVAAVGAGVLVVAPIVAQIAMLGFVAIMVFIGLFLVAFIFSGGRVLDNIR